MFLNHWALYSKTLTEASSQPSPTSMSFWERICEQRCSHSSLIGCGIFFLFSTTIIWLEKKTRSQSTARHLSLQNGWKITQHLSMPLTVVLKANALLRYSSGFVIITKYMNNQDEYFNSNQSNEKKINTVFTFVIYISSYRRVFKQSN